MVFTAVKAVVWENSDLWCRKHQFASLLCELWHSTGLQDGRGQIGLLLLLDLLSVLLSVTILHLTIHKKAQEWSKAPPSRTLDYLQLYRRRFDTTPLTSGVLHRDAAGADVWSPVATDRTAPWTYRRSPARVSFQTGSQHYSRHLSSSCASSGCRCLQLAAPCASEALPDDCRKQRGRKINTSMWSTLWELVKCSLWHSRRQAAKYI